MFRQIQNQIRNFHLFNKYPIAKEFIKFCLVGFSNLLVDMTVYWLLTRVAGWYYLFAAVGSFMVAVTWSFFINRRWTFRHTAPDLHWQYLKFFIANLIAAGLNLSLLFVFVDLAQVHDLLAKLFVAVIVAFVNFPLNKFWTFKK